VAVSGWAGVENADILVADVGSLAVHQSCGMNDFSAKGLPDALVAQADTEDRQLAGKAPDQRHRNAGLVGRARPRGNDDSRGMQSLDLFQRDFVIAENADLLAQLTQVLHQVVGEGIVIVDHQ
jgi:hypothetical protein